MLGWLPRRVSRRGLDLLVAGFEARITPLAKPLLQRSAEYRADGDADHARGAVRLAFGASQISQLPRLTAHLEEIATSSTDPSSAAQRSSSALDAVLQVQRDDLNAQQWDLLCHFLAAHGLLRASLLARERTRERDIRGDRGSDIAARALLDSDDPDLDQLVAHLPHAQPSTRSLATLLGVCDDSLLQPKPDITPFTAGRSVALVGSAVLTGNWGARIDDHHLIARTKYFGSMFMQDASEVGRRADIAYYNKATGPLLRKASNSQSRDTIDALDQLQMLIVKGTTSSSRAKGLKGVCPTYLSSALLGTRAIFHLLLGRPAHLSIYGFDFYLAETSHYADDFNEIHRTEMGRTRTDAGMCHSFGQHHPVSQLRFVRNLWRAGALTPYGRTAEVLSMTDLEYVTGLEERYSQW